MHFSSIKQVEKYLNRIPKFQSEGHSAADFDLSKFQNFCDKLGNPERAFTSIHVGGTNGKGSTCHILGTVYKRSGYRVGVYTSPHIINFQERFLINGQQIPDEQLISFFNNYADHIVDYQLTYFEISTAIAFWWFARSKVDLAVIEVGLGGRLDATNIIEPAVSVITSIGLDHTDILGDRLEDIAKEKGGIIKEGRPVVLGDLPGEACSELISIAEQKKAKIHTIDNLKAQYCEPGNYKINIDDSTHEIGTNLTAPVQCKNIAMAWRVVALLQQDFPVSPKQFVESLGDVDLGFGRFDRLTPMQQWYFDGGHNLEAVKTLKQSIETIGDIKEAVLVLAMMKDKVREEVMVEFSEFKNIYYYQVNVERAATFNDINRWLPDVKSFPVNQDQQLILNDFDKELVIFAGSFYFYRTVRDWVSTFVLNH